MLRWSRRGKWHKHKSFLLSSSQQSAGEQHVREQPAASIHTVTTRVATTHLTIIHANVNHKPLLLLRIDGRAYTPACALHLQQGEHHKQKNSEQRGLQPCTTAPQSGSSHVAPSVVRPSRLSAGCMHSHQTCADTQTRPARLALHSHKPKLRVLCLRCQFDSTSQHKLLFMTVTLLHHEPHPR